MRIVLVDDSETFRARLKRHLADDPTMAVVGEAGDGVAALRMVEELRPDVVLLDLYMPIADGFSVLGHLKAQLQTPRVIVLTSDASAGVRQRCVILRADAVIDKGDASLEVLPALRMFQ